MHYALAIDLGGTAIKGGLYTQTGQPVNQTTIPTPYPASPEQVLLALTDLIRQLDPQHLASIVGIGVPGITDRRGRIVKTAINLHHWHNIPLAEALEPLINRRVVAANDANCAGLGEVWLGAARGLEDVLLLTLGTGVGGAVILAGRLFSGYGGAGAELGHITLWADGPGCNCGSRGCLEQYVAIPAIQRRTGLDPLSLSQKALQGDPIALAQWQEIGQYLGIGLSSLIYVFNPQAIVIGGGISASAELFMPSARAEIDQRVLPACREDLLLIPAELGNDAGMVGAARLAFQTFA